MKRTDIVACARTYIDTPFEHQGRIKGQKMDCVGLPLCVAGELGLRSTAGDTINGDLHRHYSPQPQGDFVHQMCAKYLVRKGVSQMQPGDVLTLRIETAACHVAIVGDSPEGLTLIHAYSGGAEKVVEHRIDDRWHKRIVGCFSFPEVVEE
jgi:NlpC/P60 family putative phage cell wall peptidase